MFVALLILLVQDPTEQLRRQELALRLSELADAEKLDGFARAVQRELRGTRIDGPLFDQCWRPVARRRWEGRLDALIAAWEKTAEPPTPGRLLYRAKLEELALRPKVFRERLEEAGRKYPTEPVLLWALARARFDAGDRGPAARTLEQLAAVPGATFDADEFHRLLVTCYAETGSPDAAVEHLRAVAKEEENAVELARLAARSKLPDEAARLYRIALGDEPDRISLRMGLIVALNAAGERAQAAAERALLFQVDGKFSPSKMQDYFHLLPEEGRAAEIVRTIRDLRDPAVTLLPSTPVESRTSVMAEWERTCRDGDDWSALVWMKLAWASEKEQLETLTKAEGLFPNDPAFVRYRIDVLARTDQYKETAEAYARLVELDPDGKRTQSRPVAALQTALTDLGLKDVPVALSVALRILSQPRLDEASALAVRTALKPGWELSPGDYWAQLKKAPLPKPPKELAASWRVQLDRLSSEEFEERRTAAAELRKAGMPALPVLMERIDDPDAEVRSRAREIIRSVLTE
jgi:tetratricopeptide (TPR) repeat protein